MMAKGKGKTGKSGQGKSLRGPKKSLPSRIPGWTILILFCALFLTQTVLSVRQESATFDETDHLPAGYVYWRVGDYGVNPEHPPFVKMLAAFPLLFVRVTLPPLPTEIGEQEWGFGRQLLYEANDADRLLFMGRMAVLPLALLLGLAVFLWARDLFGRGAAIFALFLYTFEPNILAHAPLVNTDLGAACFIFLAIYTFWRLVQRVSASRLLLASGSLALALITKFSSLQLLPLFLLLGFGVVVTRQGIEVDLKNSSPIRVADRTRKLLILLATMLVMGLMAYLTIWMVYRFRYAGIIVQGERTQFPWNGIPGKPWMMQVFALMRETKLLPEAYLFGMARVFTTFKRVAFLMGQISTDGWWYYFFVTFLLKTPLPFLLLLAVTPLALRRVWRENRLAAFFLLVPVLVYFGIASASRLNIGHRHLLPVYPFLIVMVSSLVPWVMKQRTPAKAGVVILAAWYLVSSVSIFPHYLAYFNELVGGPDNGYKYLVDSNLDWGQDLKGLKRYMDAHRIPRVWLSYFGTASPEYYGITYNFLPSYIIFNGNDDEVLTPFTAISATNLMGVYFPDGLGLDADFFKDFRGRRPVAKIGYSIFIYRRE